MAEDSKNKNNKIIIQFLLLILTVGFIFLCNSKILMSKHRFFVNGPSMYNSRVGHTMTLLSDGRVLIIGGAILNKNPVFCNYAEIYNPKTNKIDKTMKMNVSRIGHTATLLKNGNVLIVGGMDEHNRRLSFVEIYNPIKNKFYLSKPLNVSRADHTATLLKNSNVLIAGGSGINKTLSSAEIFDFTTNQFKLIKKMNSKRYSHTATLLKNGNVLITGGANDHEILSSAEIYNPKTQQFKYISSMLTSRWQNTATLLKNGDILFLGGRNKNNQELSTAEMFNVKSNKFINVAGMKYPRANHSATLLSDGNVLITGGIAPLTWGGTILSNSIIYCPNADKYININNMKNARARHRSILLKNGNVFITGGEDEYNSLRQRQSELFIN